MVARSPLLIVGASGMLGREVAARLLQAGQPLRLMTRRPATLQDLARAGAEVVDGDLRDIASLQRACAGADAVLAAAHSLFGRGSQASTRVDGQGHRDLIDAARAAGVRRFVYVSALGCDGAFNCVPFFRIKHETEQYLRDSGLDWVILRPTAFMEMHAHTLIGLPVLQKGKVTLVGSGERPRNFVSAGDVAHFATLALLAPALARQTLEIGGPENLSNREVVRLYERLAGRPARISQVPAGLLRAISLLLRPLHPGLSQVLQTGALADTAEQSFDATPLMRRFGHRLARLEEVAARMVAGATA